MSERTPFPIDAANIRAIYIGLVGYQPVGDEGLTDLLPEVLQGLNPRLVAAIRVAQPAMTTHSFSAATVGDVLKTLNERGATHHSECHTVYLQKSTIRHSSRHTGRTTVVELVLATFVRSRRDRLLAVNVSAENELVPAEQVAPQQQPSAPQGRYRIAAVVAAGTEGELVSLITSYKRWLTFNGVCVLWGLASMVYLLVEGPPDGPSKRLSETENLVAMLVYIGVLFGVSGLMWGSTSIETLKEGKHKLSRLRVRQRPTPMAWYTFEQWAAVKEAAIDPDDLEDTYEEWVAAAQKQFAVQVDQGLGMKKVNVEAKALLAWCEAEKRMNDAAARAHYASKQILGQ